MLIYSGVRISEMLDLLKSDVHLDEQFFDVIDSKTENGIRKVPIADKVLPNQCLDDVCLEISGRGKGDMREPFVDIEYADGSRTCDFRYNDYRVCKKVGEPV